MFAVASRTFDVVHVDGWAREQISPSFGLIGQMSQTLPGKCQSCQLLCIEIVSKLGNFFPYRLVVTNQARIGLRQVLMTRNRWIEPRSVTIARLRMAGGTALWGQGSGKDLGVGI